MDKKLYLIFFVSTWQLANCNMYVHKIFNFIANINFTDNLNYIFFLRKSSYYTLLNSQKFNKINLQFISCVRPTLRLAN